VAKAFDATMKQLLDEFGSDWAGWIAPRIGLPAGVEVDPLDVDLSTVQYSADKVFRLRPPAEGLLHLEPQSSWDGELADRMNVYSTLLYHRYKVPVYSVALLLRWEANAASLTGTLSRFHADGKEYLRFVYDVMRVWELPCEPLLAGGPGIAPLALLTDEAKGRLPELVTRLDNRLREEKATEKERKLLLTSSFILLGLRYTDDIILESFLGVQGMKESTTFQWIMEEGRKEGRQEGEQIGITKGLVIARRDTLLAILRDRFPELSAETKARIEAIDDPDMLQRVILKALHVERIEDLSL
jgi:predicted transposase YdaD